MSIMEMFRNVVSPQPAPQPATAQPKPGEAAPTPGVQSAPSPAGVAGAGIDPTTNVSQNPMSKFDDLWKPTLGADGKPVQSAAFDPNTMFNIDPAKVAETAKQFNFSQQVPAEVMQRIAQGGEDGVKASMEAITIASQAAFAQSMMGAAKLVQQGIATAMPAVDSRVNESVRRTQVSSALREANPLLATPFAAPIISAIENQIVAKYPTATPAELKTLAQEAMVGFAQQLTGHIPKPTEQAAPGEVDWEKYLKNG